LIDSGSVLYGLTRKNKSLVSFKGTGKITIYEKKKKGITAQIAWIGETPDRLRIFMRDFTGQSLISFAVDGKYLYLFLHYQDKFYKKRSKYFSFNRFIHLPVKVIDMVTVLSGGVPLGVYESTRLFKLKKGYILILFKNGEPTCKLYLDEDKKNIRKIEIFNMSGSLAYRTVFGNFKDIDGYTIPFRMNFSDDKGSGFKLDINRYWANVPVSPSMFVLSKPDKE